MIIEIKDKLTERLNHCRITMKCHDARIFFEDVHRLYHKQHIHKIALTHILPGTVAILV